MDIIKAIKSRYTVRAFKPVPVSRELLQELLEIAVRAPSWENTQTWEFAVIGGEVLEELKKIFVARVIARDKRNPDIAYPDWSVVYQDRSKENGRRLFNLLNIQRDDRERKLQWYTQMYNFFGAPSCIIVCIDKGLSEWAILNVGLVVQNITLAALQYGLGTAILATGISFPDNVRKLVSIPDSKQLIIAIAIGYPDEQQQVNEFRSNRVPIESITTWHGF